jgi:uncharacterized protein (DUF305 family)
MKKNILVAAALLLSVAFLQACNSGDTKSETTSDTTAHSGASTAGHENDGAGSGEHDQMMKKMMNDMNAVKMTGDFDLDFANMMIPHHQSAVDMAEQYIPKAKDEKIKSMAQNIINAQKKEIEELRTMIASHKPTTKKKEEHSASGHDAGGHSELMDAMNKMMEEMKSMKMTGNADKDFVTMMIPHHKSAVDMAENEISHGKNVQLKQFAQKVINDQSKEINEFQSWLNNNK